MSIFFSLSGTMFWKNTLLFFWAYFSVINAQIASNLTKCRENAWPYDLVTPFPYRTLVPIELDTSSVRILNATTPLRFVIGAFEYFTITNTGYSVEITTNKPHLSSICGGPLGTDVYTFYKGDFFWAGTYKGTVGNGLDGLSAPIQIRGTFLNTKYGTFQNAILHRDGLAIVVINVQVEGYVSNPAFDCFAGLLQKIQKAGTSTQSTSLPLFSWYNNVPTLVKYYYAFPGAYIDLANGNTQYDSATMIAYPKGYQTTISITQFQYFLNLLNCNNTPITNVQSARNSGSRPIVQVVGFTEIVLPTSS